MAEVKVSLDIENMSNKKREQMLFQSCLNGQRDVVDSLLSKGVRPNCKDRDGRTPLVLASMSGHEDIVTLILDQGVDVRNKLGLNAFMKACENGHVGVVKTLMERGVDLDETDIYGTTSLMCACMKGHDEVVEILIDRVSDPNERDDEGSTALMCACVNGHDKVVEILIKHVPNVNEKYDEGTTALMCACMNGSEKVVQLLIHNVSDLNEKDNEGKTALMWACINGHEKVVELLIELKCDPNDTDDDGTTPLMFASMFGHDKVVQILIKHVSDLNGKHPDGTTALKLACLNGHDKALRILIEHNVSDFNVTEYIDRADLMRVCGNGYDKVLKILIEYGVNLDGATPLIEACKGGFITVVELLIEQGIDVNACDDDGNTPMMTACINRQKRTKKKVCENESIYYAQIIKLLLQHGANVDIQNTPHGWSAVMVAVRTDNVDCLQVLLPARPSLDLVDKEEKTVFSHAMENTNTKCLTILLNDGGILTDGRLKPIHKDSNIPFITKESLLMTIEFGVFEWDLCPLRCVKPVTLAALKSGLIPGKIKYDSNTYLSPFIVSVLINDKELIQTLQKRLYYFPEDYRTLIEDTDIRGRIENTDVLDKITLQPLSLQTWCCLTASKAISTPCFPDRRRERVDSLPIPNRFKTRLHFE